MLKYGRLAFHRMVKCVYLGETEWHLGKSDNHLIDPRWVTHDLLSKILKSSFGFNASKYLCFAKHRL